LWAWALSSNLNPTKKKRKKFASQWAEWHLGVIMGEIWSEQDFFGGTYLALQASGSLLIPHLCCCKGKAAINSI
jgi:hypothetical protein